MQKMPQYERGTRQQKKHRLLTISYQQAQTIPLLRWTGKLGVCGDVEAKPMQLF
jgi:hypothetical protein